MTRIAGIFWLAMAAAASAQHFSLAFVDIGLTDGDSVRLAVEADAQDLMNSVYTFPYFDADTGTASYRRYETKMEYYLQQKVKLWADGKRIQLKVGAWKPEGKGREDGLDSVSIQEPNHRFTLVGRLPSRPKMLSIRTDLWEERAEIDTPPLIEYSLNHQGVPLLYRAVKGGISIQFDVSPKSLAEMKKSTPTPRYRVPEAPGDHEDHTGHNH